MHPACRFKLQLNQMADLRKSTMQDLKVSIGTIMDWEHASRRFDTAVQPDATNKEDRKVGINS